MPDIEAIGIPLGVGLTFLVLTYLVLGDNPFYKFALHVFVGVLTGYSFGIVVREIIVKMALGQLQSASIMLVPLAMGLWLLFFKSVPRLAYVGNFALAYLIGVGAAVALSGALLGTLIPQVEATARAWNRASFADGLLVIVGTVCTLMAFNFAAPEQRGLSGIWAKVIRFTAWIGRVFLIIALGAAFAGAVTTFLSIFIHRIQFIIDFFMSLL